MNQPFSLEHKIQNEKRRRTQIYSTIDYFCFEIDIKKSQICSHKTANKNRD